MQKYKVHISSGSLPDKEIAPYKDFETLLKKRKSAMLVRQFTRLTISIVTVGLLIGSYFYINQNSKLPDADSGISIATSPILTSSKPISAAVAIQSKVKTKGKEMPDLSTKKIVINNPDDNTIAPESEKKEINTREILVKSVHKFAKNKVPTTVSSNGEILKINQTPETENPEVNTITVFSKPEPTVGFDGLFAFFANELKLPETATSIKGLVLVSFAINETGQPEELKVEKSLSAAHDAEALRLIKKMPLWKPALANGQPVKTRVAVPVRF